MALIDERVNSILDNNSNAFLIEYSAVPCFKVAVNTKYKELLTSQNIDNDNNADIANFDINENFPTAVNYMWKNQKAWSQSKLRICLQQKEATDENTKNAKNTSGGSIEQQERPDYSPFDRRLDRLFITGNNEATIRTPFATKYSNTGTSGYLVSTEYLNNSEIENLDEAIKLKDANLNTMKSDSLYRGVPSLMNAYAITKLYGSNGGQNIINKRGKRRWYEVDQAFGSGAQNLSAFSMNPTTSSLISWGNADPYERTPYHFTDFVFSKYWKKIENNRLITLRRYAAPILDNLKFPGMDGTKVEGGVVSGKNSGSVEGGSSSKVLFPPMAHAITYFGEETGNTLNSLLKFTSGMNWDEVQSDVWSVGTQSVPDNESGPGLYSGLSSISKYLNVAGGNFNPQLIMNKGDLPPDPYTDGPYENRILGPVNRIDTVKKRAAGLQFEWQGLNIVFEYVARPIGGINSKAVLLDILSNFLVIGSASAVFFGGQHRFMGNPAQYPFLGGEKGIEAWYSGKPLEWANQTIDSFAGNITNPDGGLLSQAKGFFDQLLGKTGAGGIEGIFGAVKGLFTGDGAGGNLLKAHLAEKSNGHVPYLSGLKALLTGEPVGEWHVTIGNPLNPIAMIGNLICNGVEVEFGDELGPDDFPTEMKITVKMDHGMARDRDAIQSIFNRGMGRIYDLPDKFAETGQTKVDKNTANASETGTAAISRGWLAGPSKLGSRSGESMINEASNSGNTSVWAHVPFRAVSANESLLNEEGIMGRSAYRQVDWIALKSLK